MYFSFIVYIIRTNNNCFVPLEYATSADMIHGWCKLTSFGINIPSFKGSKLVFNSGIVSSNWSSFSF